VYVVATISRLLKIIGLFCEKALQKRRYSAKETYNFKEPTIRSRPIRVCYRHHSWRSSALDSYDRPVYVYREQGEEEALG